MYRQLRLSLVIPIIMALVVVTTSCATGPRIEYDQQADFSRYKTFNWLEPAQQEVEDPILDSQLLAKRVASSTKGVMAVLGYTMTSDAPDMLVTYHTASKEKLRSPRFGVGVGYSRYYHHWRSSVIFGNSVESYEQGILIIDVVDASTNNLVWRGWETSLLSQRNFSEEAVNKAVNKILLEFPPAYVR